MVSSNKYKLNKHTKQRLKKMLKSIHKLIHNLHLPHKEKMKMKSILLIRTSQRPKSIHLNLLRSVSLVIKVTRIKSKVSPLITHLKFNQRRWGKNLLKSLHQNQIRKRINKINLLRGAKLLMILTKLAPPC
jgi:hypothetical protein